MSNPEIKYPLSKTESQLFSTLAKLGGQTKQELLLTSGINVEKVDNALLTLIDKGFIQIDEETGIYQQSLPLENLMTLLKDSSVEIETNKKELEEVFQYHRKIIDENIGKLRENLETQFEGIKDSNNALQTSLREKFEEIEQQRTKQTEEHQESLLSSFSTNLTNIQTEFQSSLSSDSSNFEKEWLKVLDGFQSIPETGTRTLKGSISKYENELSEIIKLSVKKITSIQSQLSDIVTAIETESTNQIQEFFTNIRTFTEDFKTNLNTSLQESSKQERDFLNEIRQRLQVTLGEELNKTLEGVVTNLSEEVDKEINQAVDNIKKQTDSAIDSGSNQIKAEFKEFLENASELIQEQKASLDVLNSELTTMSSAKKLTAVSDSFKRQLQAHLSADMNNLEINYRRAQKATIDIIEEIRRSAKDRLIQQSKEFEGLIHSYNTIIEKSIARKDLDISHLQRISQSIVQLLGNLLISVPMRSNHFKTTLKNSINNSVLEIKEGMSESSLSPVNDIYNSLSGTQKRIETTFKETLEESQNEVQKAINTTVQLNSTVNNLQEAFLEKVEHRFEQRAKVMNTELEATARNFQQVINAVEGGFGDINTRLSAETITTNMETTLQNSVTQLKNDVDLVFTQSQKDSSEYITRLDTTLQTQLDRTLDVIKEGFSQIKTEFTADLENQLNQINRNSENQQINLNTIIDSFSGQSIEQFTKFKTELDRTIEESQKKVTDFITESQKSTTEVIELQQSNIEKYQEKGTNDILSFINQIESEVINQNQKVKDSMEELGAYYSGYSDSTLGEVNSLLRQVQESGDKLSTFVIDSLQSAAGCLDKITEDVDLYYSDSLSDLENQISVTTGFVTSEIENSTKVVQEEVGALKGELSDTVEGLSVSIKDQILRQDQEFQTKTPEQSQEFSQVFDDLIQERTRFNNELEEKTGESLTKLMEDWNTELEKNKTRLKDVSEAIDKAIEANLENIKLIVETNVEEIILSFSSILNLETSKEDVLGLNEILEKVNTANKRLKSAISEILQVHIEQFDQEMVPELVTSYEAAHNQMEEDLSTIIEDLGDSISSAQTAYLNQLHKYLKEESQSLDFSEMKGDLNGMFHAFSQATTEDIETLSIDLADSIQITIKDVEKSREQIHILFTKLSAIIVEQNANLMERLTKLKEELSETLDKTSNDFGKDLDANLTSYNTELNKHSLELTGKTNQITQTVIEELDSQVSKALTRTHEHFDKITNTNSQQIETLQTLASEYSRIKPLDSIRFINLPSDEAKNEFIIDMIKSASKQVFIVTSNPTFLSVADLKAIPSDKRIFIITDYDFTKKGKKWIGEVGNQININFYNLKTKNISGILVMRDETSVLILPNSLGFISTDEKLVTNLSRITNLLKGASLKVRTSNTSS
ncbi:MAG: helix-turn-helix domain-containing protein [Candidatus Thorarchaeota archaeon]